MGKRKHQPLLHQQEQCDVWLSTAQKKEQTPAAKRQRVFRPMTNIADVVLSSQPIKAGTKQTDIKNFFAPKSAGQENVAPKASSSSGNISKQTNISKNKRAELPLHRAGGHSGSCKSPQNDEGKSASAISMIHSSNRCFDIDETHLISRVDKINTNKTTLLHDSQNTNMSSSQDLDTDELFQFSQDSPRVSGEDEDPEDITFTMGTQGCLKVREHKTRGNVDSTTLNMQGCLKTIAQDSDHVDMVSAKLQDSDLYSRIRQNANRIPKVFVTKDVTSTCNSGFQSYQDVPKSEISNALACCDLKEREESEDVTFTMGSQGCMKVKQPRTKRHTGPDISTTQDCFTAAMTDSELLSNSLGDTPYLLHPQRNQKTLMVAENTSSILNESRDIASEVENPVETQECSEVKQLKQNICVGHHDTLDPEDLKSRRLDIMLSEDLAFTMGSQGCLKVRGRNGNRSNILPPENSLPDTAFTVGSEGHLRVRDSQGQNSSEDPSQEVVFTIDSQGCQKVRGHTNERSVIMPIDDFPKDLAFTLGSQGRQKVKGGKGLKSNTLSKDSPQGVAFTLDSKGQRVKSKNGQWSNILSEDLSQELSFTMGSQGCLKVRANVGHMSNIAVSEDSEDVSLTIVSQRSLKDRGSKGHKSLDDSQEDVNFTMGSQGCLRVRETKGHTERLISSKDLSEDMAFIMASQGQKFRDKTGNMSNVLTEDSSSDSAFTMDSKDVRDIMGHTSDTSMPPEDSSEEVAFTMGSQGCLKVRDSKCHRSGVMTSPNQLAWNDSLDYITREVGEEENKDGEEDDEFSQTQDW